MYPYSLSIPLSAELKMPFLGTSSPACWDRTYYVRRVEFTKLAPYGASCYSSNQASFQESDPFQLVSEKSAAAKWIVLVVDIPESHAIKPFIEVGRTTFCLCFWQYPKNTRDAPVCIRVLGIFHTYLEHSTVSWPKEDASHTGFCRWICYLRQAERDLPFFQMPQRGQKSLTVNCF